MDNKGNYFVVPNFCINDPFLQKELKEVLNDRKGKAIHVCISYQRLTFRLHYSNSILLKKRLLKSSTTALFLS